MVLSKTDMARSTAAGIRTWSTHCTTLPVLTGSYAGSDYSMRTTSDTLGTCTSVLIYRERQAADLWSTVFQVYNGKLYSG